MISKKTALIITAVAIAVAACNQQKGSKAVDKVEDTDLAQSMIVTVWNLAIDGGGLLGGAILRFGSVGALSWCAVLLLALTGCVVFLNRKVGFA